jgi:hypothetical protein
LTLAWSLLNPEFRMTTTTIGYEKEKQNKKARKKGNLTRRTRNGSGTSCGVTTRVRKQSNN